MVGRNMMQPADIKTLFEIIKNTGIHPAPETLSKEELEKLSGNPEAKTKLFRALGGAGINLYQELEMSSPYVNTHRDVSYTPENLQLHSHAFFEIIYCESGTIQYLIADTRYRIHAGDVILVPPGISHRPIFYEEMTEPYSRIVLWISSDFFHTIAEICPEELRNQLRLKEHFLLRTEGTPYKYLGKLFQRGVEESTLQAPMWEMALCGNTTNLLANLGRALMSAGTFFPAEQREDIDEVISYIEKNYSGRISLEETAKEFHISTSTLSKLFYNKLHISFYHFVTQRRLINSKLKIEEGSSMEEAALSCGFCDYSAFYRAFKKEFGISPKEYRKIIFNA